MVELVLVELEVELEVDVDVLVDELDVLELVELEVELDVDVLVDVELDEVVVAASASTKVAEQAQLSVVSPLSHSIVVTPLPSSTQAELAAC